MAETCTTRSPRHRVSGKCRQRAERKPGYWRSGSTPWIGRWRGAGCTSPPIGETVRWRKKEFVIRLLEFQSGRVSEVYRRAGPFDQVTLTVSPNEEWILFGERPMPTSELMLIENFR